MLQFRWSSSASRGWITPGTATDDKAYKSLTVYGDTAEIQQDYVDEPEHAYVTAGSLHAARIAPIHNPAT